MLFTGLLLVLIPIGTVSADYFCACNYDVEKEVYATMSEQGASLGYMYEFDCKQELTPDNLAAGWIAVAFQHKMGYIQDGSQIQKQTCLGDPPADDLIITTTPVAGQTTTVTSSPSTEQPTQEPVTTTTSTNPTTVTTPQPTTVTTTPQPTTVTTTPQPTTVTTTPQPTTVTTTPQPTTVTTTAQPTTRTTAATTQMPTTSTPLSTMPSQTGTPNVETGHLELCPSQVVHAAYIGHGLVAQYGTSCYEVVPSLVSWTHAESNCKRSGGHLVTINSATEQNFLYNFLDTNYNHTMWIGLEDRQQEENFTWVSGEPLSYTNWVPNRKSFNHNYEDCVYMVPSQDLQGKWDDIRCGGTNAFNEAFSEKHRYICEYHVDSTMTTFAPVSPGSHASDGNTMLCPYSIRRHADQFGGMLAQYKEQCYELLPRHAYTWTHGEQVCEAHRGKLAHISDADEQDFIQQFMKRHYPDHAVWIGLTDRGHEGNFTWTSGVPVQYTNWTPDHVGNFVDPSREDCVAFIPYKNGEWDDITCGSSSFFGGDSGETHPILCQYRTDIAGSIIG